MSGYSAAWSSAFDWGSKGREFESLYPDHFFCPDGAKKHEAWKGFASWHAVPLHTAQPCFMHRRCASYIRLFRWSSSISFRYEAFSVITPNMKHSLRSYDEKMENESLSVCNTTLSALYYDLQSSPLWLDFLSLDFTCRTYSWESLFRHLQFSRLRLY